MSPWIGKALGGFHHQLIRRLMGRMPHPSGDGVLTYPPLGEATEEAGLQEIETYIACRQNTVAQYIATRPIMDLCLVVERRPGVQVLRQWW